jgi:hypothetical protein
MLSTYTPQVPKALADKVRAYYSYVVEREVQADEADIITGLSASLRTQVSMPQASTADVECTYSRFLVICSAGPVVL